MQQRSSPKNVEPSQSTPSPNKPVADQPGEPRQSRAETPVLIAVSVYHRLKNFSSSWLSRLQIYVVRSHYIYLSIV